MHTRPEISDDTNALGSPGGFGEIEVSEEFRFRRRCNIAAVVIAILALGVLCSLSTKHITKQKDHFSDMNVLMAGENFARHGFFRLRFLPVHYVAPAGETPLFYLHYPPLPDIVNGLVRIMGVESLAVMRAICALFAMLGILCMYAAFVPIIGHLAAVCGMGFVASTGYLLGYGMSVHTHAYNLFFLGLFFLLFLRAVEKDNPSPLLWVGCWVVLLLSSLTSYEFILYPQIFAWAYVISARRFRKNWFILLILGLGPLTGVLLHFLQNVWAVGWETAWADRLGFGHFSGESRWELWARLPQSLLSRSNRFYHWRWPVLPLFGVICLIVARCVRPKGVNLDRVIPLFAGVVAAALGWYVFLPGHALPHQHTVNQLFPLLYLVMGGIIAMILRWGFAKDAPLGMRAGAALGILAIIYGQIQTIRPRLSGDGILPASIMSEALGPHELPRNVGLLFNTAASAQFKYFIRRPAWRSPSMDIPFPESITELSKHLPPDWPLKYYVFYAPSSQESAKVLSYLSERCPGNALMVPRFDELQRFIILFDISELQLPPEQRKGLDPERKKIQLTGSFPIGNIPNFTQRVQQAYKNQTGPDITFERTIAD